MFRLARMAPVLALAFLVAAPAIARADVPVTVTYSGSGTYTANLNAGDDPTSATANLNWVTTFEATMAQDGTITPVGTGTVQSGPGSFTYTDPNFSINCSGPLPVSTSAGPPLLQASGLSLTVQSVTLIDQDGSSGGYAGCQGTAPGSGLPFDGSSQAANLVGAMDPQMPGVMSATVQLPGPLSNTAVLSVSNSNAPQQLSSSCADQFGTSDCTMTMTWTGTVTIEPPCGTITLSEGGALPVGSIVAVGETVTTGLKQRLEITTTDGAIMRLGPESAVQCQGGSFQAGKRELTWKLVLGNLWEAVSDALGGDQSPVQTERAGTGVRGSEYTLSVHGKTEIAHVIEGTGFVQYKGKKEFDYPAGFSARIGKKSATLTSRWPAADRALVPAGKLPPKLTKVKLKGRKLSFRLDRKASLQLQLLKGKKVVFTAKKLHGRKGENSLHPFKRKLRKGRYVLRLVATANTRSTAAQLSFRTH